MLAIALAAPALAQQAAAPPKTVFLPAPPEPVCGGMVERAEWSPDGRYAIAIRRHIVSMDISPDARNPQMETEIAVWSDAARRATTVLTDRTADTAIESIDWYPGSSSAFLLAAAPNEDGSRTKSLWRIDARRAAAAVISGVSEAEEFAASPKLPCAFLWQPVRGAVQMRPVSAAGVIGAPIRVEGAAPPVQWSKDGGRLFFGSTAAAIERIPAAWLAYDVRKGTTASAALPLDSWVAPIPKPAYQLEQAKPAGAPSADILPWAGANPRPLWLVQDAPKEMARLMIAVDADEFHVSPRLDAVLYANREGAFVVRLSRIDGAVLAHAREAAQRAMLLSNGKQIALGLLMYMQDHDDLYPTQDQDLKALLQPYIKNDAVFAGPNGEANAFQYVYPGVASSDIKNPAETILGTIAGPGGHAVVYADGHVKWETGG
jgi:hypothetical protein